MTMGTPNYFVMAQFLIFITVHSIGEKMAPTKMNQATKHEGHIMYDWESSLISLNVLLQQFGFMFYAKRDRRSLLIPQVVNI